MNTFWYKIIKKYYNMGLYTDKDLEIFVPNYISKEQKQEIITSINL